MKKQNLKKLELNKNTISKFNAQRIKGGVSGECTSSIDPYQCPLACATGGTCRTVEC